MNDLTFLVEFEDPDREYRPWVIPFVDGLDLRDLVVAADPRPVSPAAGGVRFGGIPTNLLPRLDEYYYGRNLGRLWLGRVALLGCSCGSVGCDPVYARVRLGPGQVTWSDLVGGTGETPSPLGPFRFERAAYQLALDRAATELAILRGREARAWNRAASP